RFDYDEDLTRYTADMFLGNCPRWLGDIRKAIEAGDAKQLHLAAHSLKGAIGHFTDAEPHRLAFDLEQLGKRNEMAEAASTLPALESAMSGLELALRAMLEALPAAAAAESAGP